jgi:NifB/MoaA-like Fe-S oxidoreductase
MDIPPVTADYARALVEEYPTLHRTYRRAEGGRFVVLSDEWYILAEQEVPKASFYQDLAIEENGVGQVRAFLDRFQKEQRRFPRELELPTRFTIATGALAESVFRTHVLPRLNMIGNLSVNLQAIPNTLFGAPVTVAGLLSGEDFLARLTGADMGDAVWTTHRILNDAGSLTLDDMSPAQISDRLGVPFNTAADSILEIFQRGIRG